MRIECRDNLEFMKSIEDKSIDVIYCDIYMVPVENSQTTKI